VHDSYRSWRAIADAEPGRMLVGEVWLPDAGRLARYVAPVAPGGVLGFDRGAAVRCIANLSATPVGLPPGAAVLLASAPLAARTPANVTDGNADTYWESADGAGYPQTITVNLGSVQSIGSVTLDLGCCPALGVRDLRRLSQLAPATTGRAPEALPVRVHIDRPMLRLVPNISSRVTGRRPREEVISAS
jgi:hypothetical protein